MHSHVIHWVSKVRLAQLKQLFMRAPLLLLLSWLADWSGRTENGRGCLWDVLVLPDEFSILVAQTLIQVDPGNVDVIEGGVVAALASEAADQVAALADIVGHCQSVSVSTVYGSG